MSEQTDHEISSNAAARRHYNSLLVINEEQHENEVKQLREQHASEVAELEHHYGAQDQQLRLQHQDEIQELEDHIRKLEDEKEAMNNQLNSLKGCNDIRGNQLHTLARQVKCLETQVAGQKDQISAKDTTIEELEARLTEHDERTDASDLEFSSESEVEEEDLADRHEANGDPTGDEPHPGQVILNRSKRGLRPFNLADRIKVLTIKDRARPSGINEMLALMRTMSHRIVEPGKFRNTSNMLFRVGDDTLQDVTEMQFIALEMRNFNWKFFGSSNPQRLKAQGFK